MKFLFYIFAIVAIVLFGWFWIFKNDFPVNDSFIIEKTGTQGQGRFLISGSPLPDFML